jgi:hypothetical protein
MHVAAVTDTSLSMDARTALVSEQIALTRRLLLHCARSSISTGRTVDDWAVHARTRTLPLLSA